MINPLARVVMQNVTKTTNKGKGTTNRKNINKQTQSLSDLAKNIKGVNKTDDKVFKDKRREEKGTVKTVSFSDISRQAKGEELESISKEYKFDNRKINKTHSLSDLARSVKGNEREVAEKTNQNKKRIKNCSFSELTGNTKKRSNPVNTKYKENEVVGNYIDSKDRNIVSNLISGKVEPEEKKVTGTTILNLSQAVSNLINN